MPLSISYMMQKNAFEWGLQMIPHSEDAIQVTQHIANFLVRLGLMLSPIILYFKRITMLNIDILQLSLGRGRPSNKYWKMLKFRLERYKCIISLFIIHGDGVKI